ncbi:hypothetical protein HK104_006342, partial [Borealophlyctis nickersoniae]
PTPPKQFRLRMHKTIRRDSTGTLHHHTFLIHITFLPIHLVTKHPDPAGNGSGVGDK